MNSSYIYQTCHQSLTHLGHRLLLSNHQLKLRKFQTIVSVSNHSKTRLSSRSIVTKCESIPFASTAAAATGTKSFITTLPQPHQHVRSYHSTEAIRSSSGTKINAAIDTRMAGRRRFYKTVDITPLSAPWEDTDETNNDNNNPISPGVDGTNSASGVSIERPSQTTLRLALSPSNNNNNNNNNNDDDDDDDNTTSTTWFGVTLDGIALRTPLGTSLAVPSLPLALALASEWDDQATHIQPAQMPLMTLVCTTIDQMAVAEVRTNAIDQIMAYLRNDTTCYYVDPTENRVLHRMQSKHWDDLHKWVTEDVGVTPALAGGEGEGLIISRKREGGGKAFAGLPHGEKLMEDARKFLERCDAWTLTGMQSVTREAKSFLVGMAVMRGVMDGQGSNIPFNKDTSKAVMASRVEEEFQIENWGLVEGQHDYDRLNCSINIHAATVLVSSILNNPK